LCVIVFRKINNLNEGLHKQTNERRLEKLTGRKVYNSAE
jgi:hypothetical protein